MTYHLESKNPDPLDHRGGLVGNTLEESVLAAQRILDKSKAPRAFIFEGGGMKFGAGRLVAEFNVGADPEWTYPE